MTRILVTGADGQIGRAVTDHLVRSGFGVTALSLAFAGPTSADRVEIGDARSPEVVSRAAERADAIVHLAAIPHPSLGTPREVFTSNITSTFTVLAEAGARGIHRVVLASSINAFGVPMNPHDVMPAYFPIDEEIPTDIADAYSLSKFVDENSARMAHRGWGTTVVSLRFPFVGSADSLLARKRHADAHPASDAREGWSYLDLRDAARVVHAALEASVEGALVVGVSAEDPLVDRSTADLLSEFAPGVPVRRRIGPRESLIDTTRARTLLGFTPRYSIHRPDHDNDATVQAADRGALSA
jgi:nucleoside-diphosphate-sugar epimerase